MNKFWNLKTDGQKSRIDLFGYVGGSKEWNDGFNEKEFLDEFRAIPETNELEISVNSFGGSVYTALSIYALLKAHKGPIAFRIDGTAMSAATIITSVPSAKVTMPKGSMMMIHKVSSIAMGNTDDLRKAADDMEKLEENIISIYVEKTGRDADEIREKVNAETYFTAEEAVEFGLADEIDDTLEVENRLCGDVVMCNGLQFDAKHFAHIPEDFLKAEMPQASAQIENPKEEKPMDFETLKAEFANEIEAIRIEAMEQARLEGIEQGIAQERARIQAIEEIAVVGHEDLVNAAKFDTGVTAEALAVAILKAEKVKAQKSLADRAQESEQAFAGLEVPTETIDPVAHTEANAQSQARLDAVIAAGASGFANKK